MKWYKRTMYVMLLVCLTGAWGIYNYPHVLEMETNITMSAPIAMAPAPPPMPMEREPAPAPAPAPVHEMPVVVVAAAPLGWWENPLINSLVIPLGLYFGKKLIDLMFSRFEKKVATT